MTPKKADRGAGRAARADAAGGPAARGAEGARGMADEIERRRIMKWPTEWRWQDWLAFLVITFWIALMLRFALSALTGKGPSL